MRCVYTTAALAAILVACAWCSWAADNVPPAKSASETKPAERSAEWKKFAEYRTWQPINDEPIAMPAKASARCRPAGQIKDPHRGGFVAIYANASGRETYMSEKSAPFAEGSVIVKEKLREKDSANPEELGIMVKRQKGFDPKAGDWQFLFVDKDKQLISDRSKLTNCIDCHKIKSTTDFVYGKTTVASSPTQGYGSQDN